MSLAFADRCQDVTTTTGTGVITLAGTPPTGTQGFAAIPVGDQFHYVIQGGAEWETGVGVMLTSSTFSRVAVSDSSNAAALVNFSAGTKNVFVSPNEVFFQGQATRGVAMALAMGIV